MEFVRFKDVHFSARFPAGFTYSRSHYWMAEDGADKWKVGLTKFATRMLGELVEVEWQAPLHGAIHAGDQIGWVEGFKAASDVFACMDGTFLGGNPLLDEDACIVRSDPYIDGWLYRAAGNPEKDAMNAHQYLDLLGDTISKMRQDPRYAQE
jgi:glycine cleavage system H protein